MLDGRLFDTLSLIGQKLRKNAQQPFGGMQVCFRDLSITGKYELDLYALQLVVTGDFFQLPPVTNGNSEPVFAFESVEWKKCIEHTILLTQVFRQKDHSLSVPLSALPVS